jgi:dihydrofolate synthase / folylpolyglutamate synthase
VGITTYAQAAEFLNSFINYERMLGTGFRYDTKTFDLTHFRGLLEDLGNPQLDYPVVHVAGTKGKGSTCAFLHSIFIAAGLRSGLYTSPHINSYCERIVVNGEPIPEAEFCRILTRLAVLPGIEAHASHGNFRTVFEFLTAAAFLHFSTSRVDVAVIETGLGGRLDSTNVFERTTATRSPWLVSAIAAIGFDHTHILGDSIESISREKAGIIQRHSRVVLAPQNTEWADTVRQVISERMASSGAQSFTQADGLIAAEVVEQRGNGAAGPLTTARLTLVGDAPEGKLAAALRDGLTVQTHLAGRHQLDNIRTALAALLTVAGKPKFDLAPEAVVQGIERTRWPGRFEVLRSNPLVIVDGAHCGLSARALATTFAELYGERPVVLVAGFMRDKAAAEVCRALAGRINAVEAVCCAPPTPRALPAEQAAEAMASALGVPVAVAPEVHDALELALSAAGADAAVVVFGSMYLVGPAAAYFNRD